MPPLMPGAPGVPQPAAALAGGPAPGTGPAVAPGGQHGNQMQAMVLVKTGVEALTKSLSGLQIGSKLHTEILKALTGIGREMAESGTGGGDAQATVQQLAALAREKQMQPQQQAALAQMAGGGQPQPAAAA